jgi:AP-2 complex subunit sigma-1
VYRRYAGLFFSLGIDVSDNELGALEAIHLFVEILDHYFSNVCELDLVFNFHKVCMLARLCLCANGSAEGLESSMQLS